MLGVALPLVLTLAPCAESPPQDHPRVQRGEGRSGLAIRVQWFERESKDLPAGVVRYRFPVACDYGCQEIAAVHALRSGGAVEEDADGNVTLSYQEALAIRSDTPLCLGSITDLVLYPSAAIRIGGSRPSGDLDGAAGVRAQFTADDEILTLTEPAIRALAQKFRAEASDDLDLIRRVWAFVHGHVAYGRVERPNTAAQVLEWRRGQCGEYGKLTIALLRACTVPARGVWCLRAGNTGPAGNDHAWAEAWVRGIGWVPVRPQEDWPEDGEIPLGYHSYPVVCRPTCGMDELRAVEWENARVPTGYRGVGFFADVPAARRAGTIELFRAIANDDDGRNARRHLAQARAAHRTVQPMLLWVLAASADARAGEAAAEQLVRICGQPGRRLSLERFVAASPGLVRQRIDAAR